MSSDPKCAGALRSSSVVETVALFEKCADAQRAIRISAARDRLAIAQGRCGVVDSDFINAARHIKIVRAEFQKGATKL
jgi:hypothetical protein